MWVNRDQTRIYNANRFKLGLFGMNCSGGLTLTRAPERWNASWANNVKAAKLADEAGLEFLLPVGRWLGYKGETDTQGTSFETLTWACGLLASTNEITTFGTLHVSFVNPIFAAKQMATIDHVGGGRFGLNIVSGWNVREFKMFGVELKEREDKYGYTREWIEIVKRIWSESEPFDHEGENFRLEGVMGKPKPVWGSRPILVSAGNSATGLSFAADHADCLFMNIPDFDQGAAKIAEFRTRWTGSQKRNIFSSAHVMVRPTRKEAQEYHHYIVREQGDWEAAAFAAQVRGARPGTWMHNKADLKDRLITGAGLPIVGSYDDAVDTFRKLSDMGLDGVAFGLVNYIDDFPHIRDGLLPRMERAGLRVPTRPYMEAAS